MSKYDEMSDFEIAGRVANLLKLCIQDPVVKNQDYISVLEPSCDMYVVKFDPCNNPNDAWPIIIESKIDIEWNQSIHGFNPSAIKYFKDENPVEVRHENPLRAAMIVFLMMKEQTK